MSVRVIPFFCFLALSAARVFECPLSSVVDLLQGTCETSHRAPCSPGSITDKAACVEDHMFIPGMDDCYEPRLPHPSPMSYRLNVRCITFVLFLELLIAVCVLFVLHFLTTATIVCSAE
ncbi:uncharacterized protein BP01DRAFT_352973 [Aspergillus saccharolyticus JOP 1030-1]|uniref:Uncharacterized protein n=1 Tax=Aspergillus saccharolyticus JOP 1030-1 TaxID=1450539 RepID=A0A318ZPG7_9EURO|nr:hypothetical protein BP01DRAFT_352973 [Aspergillus saccharolyticus JOP 1030-1]PYH49511.1 hypothetical protein BP01DRAFT_352973 [Aspergillus saccharolyticus JOP 1030-1]